ncbi:hypothetical protein JCM11641_007748 [Rhodosporidiobolus odoratus]
MTYPSSSTSAASHVSLVSSAASIASVSTVTSSGAGLGSVPNLPSASLGSQLDTLRQLVGRRMTAWTYLKNAGEGRVYWFNTILLTTDDMRATFPNDKMRNRSTRFAVLGMSLASLLDIAPAQDFLRSLSNLVQEYEAIPDERFGGKNPPKSLFKVGSKSRRAVGLSSTSAGGGGAEFSMGLPQEGGEASYLLIPNIPFDLDYFQVLITTCDMLIEIYHKIYTYLGTPAPPSSNFPPPPGARTSLPGSGANGSGAGGSLSSTLADVVFKIDGKLKKIMKMLHSEIDILARSAIRAELDNLGGGDYGLDGWE